MSKPEEIRTLEQALGYLTPHPFTKGPVILDPEKMRAAVRVIAARCGSHQAQDAAFVAAYAQALRSDNMEDVARQLSGRLRQMDKRAKAANIRADNSAKARRLSQVTIGLLRDEIKNLKDVINHLHEEAEDAAFERDFDVA